jgi:hypothetical protein
LSGAVLTNSLKTVSLNIETTKITLTQDDVADALAVASADSDFARFAGVPANDANLR